MKQAACPRCGGGPLIAFVVSEFLYEVREGDGQFVPPAIMLGARLPLASGATKSQARCAGCGTHWLRVAPLVKEWERAGSRTL